MRPTLASTAMPARNCVAFGDVLPLIVLLVMVTIEPSTRGSAAGVVLRIDVDGDRVGERILREAARCGCDLRERVAIDREAVDETAGKQTFARVHFVDEEIQMIDGHVLRRIR